MLYKIQRHKKCFVPEQTTKPSDTVPCQAPPLAELLRKAAMGVPVHMHDASYDPEEVANSFSVDPLNCIGLDRVEAETIKQDLRRKVISDLKKHERTPDNGAEAQKSPAGDGQKEGA